MIAGFTPGPWHEQFVSEKSWHKGVYDANGNEVALVKVKSALVAHRRDADARLIAAAPELLTALRGLIREIGAHALYQDLPAFNAARAAIAKATKP